MSTVDYGGVPETIVGSPIVFGSPYGFLHTDDGAFMGDEPNAARPGYRCPIIPPTRRAGSSG